MLEDGGQLLPSAQVQYSRSFQDDELLIGHWYVARLQGGGGVVGGDLVDALIRQITCVWTWVSGLEVARLLAELLACRYY